MNNRILVCCATRGRPEQLKRMVASVNATSSRADLAIYIDDDDNSYEGVAFEGSGSDGQREDRLGPFLSRGYEEVGVKMDDNRLLVSRTQ